MRSSNKSLKPAGQYSLHIANKGIVFLGNTSTKLAGMGMTWMGHQWARYRRDMIFDNLTQQKSGKTWKSTERGNLNLWWTREGFAKMFYVLQETQTFFKYDPNLLPQLFLMFLDLFCHMYYILCNHHTWYLTQIYAFLVLVKLSGLKLR